MGTLEIIAENKAEVEVSMEVENSTSLPIETGELSTETVETHYILTDKIVENLKCSLCSHYLSFTPVHIISEDGSKYKCGRCFVKTHINIRAVMYEKLAEHMKFPCIYKNCTQILSWNNVKHHEKICDNQTFTCIALNCTDEILTNNFAAHFKEKHSKMFHSNSVSVNNLHSSYGLCILELDEQCYVILYDHNPSKFGITVCAVKPHQKQFDVCLNSTGSKYSITIKGQNIINFDERYHCFKCLKGVCKRECHVYSIHTKAIMKNMTTQIERDVIRRTFGSKDVTCTISVVDEVPEKDDENLDDILLGKEMIIDEVNEEDETELVTDKEDLDIVQEMMKCPKCNDTMIPPIHQCLAGHTICSECKNKSEKCPTCEREIENTRNYVLEEVSLFLNNLKPKIYL